MGRRRHITARRHALGLSVQKFAERCKLPLNVITNIETNNRRKVHIDDATVVATALGCQVTDIFDRRELTIDPTSRVINNNRPRPKQS